MRWFLILVLILSGWNAQAQEKPKLTDVEEVSVRDQLDYARKQGLQLFGGVKKESFPPRLMETPEQEVERLQKIEGDLTLVLGSTYFGRVVAGELLDGIQRVQVGGVYEVAQQAALRLAVAYFELREEFEGQRRGYARVREEAEKLRAENKALQQRIYELEKLVPKQPAEEKPEE